MKKEKNFKELAREKQISYKNDILKVIEFDKYPSVLKDEHAINCQLIEWPGAIEEIEKIKGIKSKDGKVKDIFKNMLRSEHIPYNFFMPLKLSLPSEHINSFFSKLLYRSDIKSIKDICIELSPKPIQKYLNDRTSFDTYVNAELTDKKILGIGIEVKYTEKSYPYTATEKLRLATENNASPYYKTWSDPKFSIYKVDSYKDLGKKELKQIFRNHLLGLTMLRERSIDEFISILLYPEKNEYQKNASEKYLSKIIPSQLNTFRSVTFEEYIQIGRGIFYEERFVKLLDYIENRYIV